MGAHEAIGVMEIIHGYGRLTRRRVRDLVLEPLYLGPELTEGTPEYESFLDSVYADLRRRDNGEETPVSPETADYLREVLEGAAGGVLKARVAWAPYDGFSRQAYEEVCGLLGRYGRKYLGFCGPLGSLMPSRARVWVLVHDDEGAEPRTRGARSFGRPEGLDDPYPYPWEPVELRMPMWSADDE